MLSARHRMRTPADFRCAMRSGLRAGTSHLVVHLAVPPSPPSVQETGQNPPEPAALVGFAVSKQVGNSVVRHRVQRRLRHLMRDRVDQLPAGSRLVVRALAPSAAASSAELASSLDSALTRARRRRESR